MTVTLTWSGVAARRMARHALAEPWPRWRQLTSRAAHRGVLCFWPDRARKVTYTNPHRWLPGFRPSDGETALRTLVTRQRPGVTTRTSQRRPGQSRSLPSVVARRQPRASASAR
jgi:hypothetical protein